MTAGRSQEWDPPEINRHGPAPDRESHRGDLPPSTVSARRTPVNATRGKPRRSA